MHFTNFIHNNPNVFYPFITFPYVYLPFINPKTINCHITSDQVQQEKLQIQNNQGKAPQINGQENAQQFLHSQFLYLPQQINENQNQAHSNRQVRKRKFYASKNTQANILNQIFSFLGNQNRSYHLVEKMCKKQKNKINTFYIMMRLLKRNLKKYINRNQLKEIFQMEKDHKMFKLLSKSSKRVRTLSIEQFKIIVRVLSKHYLQRQIINSFLVSCRLSKVTIREHLKRRREIMDCLFQS